VRSATIAALGECKRSDVNSILREALNDSSYGVVSSALQSLTKADSANALSTLLGYLHVPSHNNTLANTALMMIARMDSVKGIELALEGAKYGEPLFTRYISLALLGKYWETHKNVSELYRSLLDDKNFLIRSAAIRILGDVGDESVLPQLERLAKDKNNRVAEVAAESVGKIKKRRAEGE
jgi:HEAT repeat protein